MTMIHAAIVDDNDELRAAMTKYLQTQKDIAVVGDASNGQEALKMIQEKQPDVVLLDMIMPALDGFGVLAQLQRTALEKRPRVIAVTALGRDDFIRRAVELGVMYYMIKPVDLPVLADRIREVAAHQPATPMEPLFAAGLNRTTAFPTCSWPWAFPPTSKATNTCGKRSSW